MADSRKFWFGVQPPDRPILVFGPYSAEEVMEARQAAVHGADANTKVGAAFNATDRTQAERNARFYLP